MRCPQVSLATLSGPDRADFENMQGQSYAFDPLTQTIWVQHYEGSVSRVEIVVSPSDVPD